MGPPVSDWDCGLYTERFSLKCEGEFSDRTVVSPAIAPIGRNQQAQRASPGGFIETVWTPVTCPDSE